MDLFVVDVLDVLEREDGGYDEVRLLSDGSVEIFTLSAVAAASMDAFLYEGF